MHKIYSLATVITWIQRVQRFYLNEMAFTPILPLGIPEWFFTSDDGSTEWTFGPFEAAGGERRLSERCE